MTRNARFVDERITLKYGLKMASASGPWTTGRRFASATSTS